MDDLDRLFSEYRNAFGEAGASADFTPGIWRRIEARRSAGSFLRHLAQVLVAVSVLVTLAIGLFAIPRMQHAPGYASYVDVLTADRADASELPDEAAAQ